MSAGPASPPPAPAGARGWFRARPVVLAVALTVVFGAGVMITSIMLRSDECRADVTESLAPSCGRWWGAAPQASHDVPLQTAVARLQAQTGRRLDLVRTYHNWTGVFPNDQERRLSASGHLLVIDWSSQISGAKRVTWSRIASGAEDEVIDTAAERLRTFGGPLLLSFDHEPELLLDEDNTAERFAAAFRHLRDRLSRDGVHNVRYAWDVVATRRRSGRGTTRRCGRGTRTWTGWPGTRTTGAAAATVRGAASQKSPHRSTSTWMLRASGRASRGCSRSTAASTPTCRAEPVRSGSRSPGPRCSGFPSSRPRCTSTIRRPRPTGQWQATSPPSSAAAFAELARSPAYSPTAHVPLPTGTLRP